MLLTCSDEDCKRYQDPVERRSAHKKYGIYKHGGVWFHPMECQTIEETDLRKLVAFLKGNATTAGMSIQFAYNPENNRAVEIVKQGRLCQRDIKALVEEGFTVWLYSWAWSPTWIEVDSRPVPVEPPIEINPKALEESALRFRGLIG
jgi:hypothetical protein